MKALLTVGSLIKALEKFPKGLPVRIAAGACVDDPDIGCRAYKISAGLHEYGMVADDLWSDGCDTHRTVNIPLISEKDSPNHNVSDKFLVEASEDDPDREGTYW